MSQPVPSDVTDGRPTQEGRADGLLLASALCWIWAVATALQVSLALVSAIGPGEYGRAAVLAAVIVIGAGPYLYAGWALRQRRRAGGWAAGIAATVESALCLLAVVTEPGYTALVVPASIGLVANLAILGLVVANRHLLRPPMTVRQLWSAAGVACLVVALGLLAGAMLVRGLHRASERPYVELMRSDLRNLVAAQRAHFASHGTFASAIADLPSASRPDRGFAPSAGNTITIVAASATGWSATARNIATVQTCGIYAGKAAPPFPGQSEGAVQCQ